MMIDLIEIQNGQTKSTKCLINTNNIKKIKEDPAGFEKRCVIEMNDGSFTVIDEGYSATTNKIKRRCYNSLS